MGFSSDVSMPADPTSPDYRGAAEQTAQANRPNINTAMGYQQWVKDENGNWTLNTGVSPEMQGLYNQLREQSQSAWATPLDNGAEARKRAEEAIYNQEAARLNPMYANRESQLQSQLASQGLEPGSAAYNSAMANLNASRGSDFQSAMNQSIMGGGTEAQRQMQMDLMARQAPLEALGGLFKMSSDMPTYNPGPNYLGAATAQGSFDQNAYNQKMGAYEAGQRAAAQKTAALYGSLGSIFGFAGGLLGGGGGSTGGTGGTGTETTYSPDYSTDQPVYDYPYEYGPSEGEYQPYDYYGPGYSHGGEVPGKPMHKGDDPRNDMMPAMLSPGERVLPNSITQNPSKQRLLAKLLKRGKNG